MVAMNAHRMKVEGSTIPIIYNLSFDDGALSTIWLKDLSLLELVGFEDAKVVVYPRFVLTLFVVVMQHFEEDFTG